jgi:3-oxoacyl-[acyl-carrier-protein] synthase II
LRAAERVVVTGVGMHTGHGDGDATWAAVNAHLSALTCEHPWNQGWGEPAPGEASMPRGFPAAPAPDPAPIEFLADRKSIKYMGPCTQMAVLAAGRALRDARLLDEAASSAREQAALLVATGPIAFDVEQAVASVGREAAVDLLGYGGEGLRRCHPLLPFKMLLNMPLGLVSIVFGIRGPNLILYPGADQGACAFSHALRGLRQGRFARALVGGSAHTLGLAPILSLRRESRLAASPDRAQPFSEQHAGWAPADQAAFMVLETEREASRRQVRPHAVLEEARVLGAGAADRLWRTSGWQSPQVLFTTGALSAAEIDADRTRARAVWKTPPKLASADGLLGVAPAASFCLASALACLSLGQGSVPAPLVEDATAVGCERVLVSFHDEHSAAALLLSAAARGATA